MTDGPLHCGFAAVIGAPNAGKSTLVNSLVGTKVSIVTHKVQTTRMTIRGIALHGSAQIIFVDTPGIFLPRRRLDRAMIRAAWSGVAEADISVLLVDAPRYFAARLEKASKAVAGAHKSADDTDQILRQLRKDSRQFIIVLNKIDLIVRPKLLELIEYFRKSENVSKIFLTSGKTGDGVGDLKSAIAEQMPSGPWLYPEDQLADVPQRWLAAEITREALMLRLHDELPYDSTVETEGWRHLKDKSIRIEQVIYVRRESQRSIILGKNGQTIKSIGLSARRELELTLGRRVHLFLFVKIRDKWIDDPERYRELGLEFPES